ncbi:hypothetical protein MNEG_7441, partial [Monoraphidium neglectum]
MAPTPPSVAEWPPDDPGKVLLHLDISGGSVDDVWTDVFASKSQLQEKLHRLRNDANVHESPWVSQRAELPAELFAWEAPPGAALGAPAAGKMRKVRFDAPASALGKGFSSDEVMRVLAHRPGSHYAVESEVFTTAMYGDKFAVLTRATLAARGPRRCVLHVVYAVAFSPALTRMLRPIISKGVDGGIRASFQVLRRLLAEKYELADLADDPSPPAVEGAPSEEAEAAAAHRPPISAAMPPPAPGPLGLADVLAYRDLVARLLRLHDPGAAAKALAAVLTVATTAALAAALRPAQEWCLGGGGGSGGTFLQRAACLPVTTGLVSLPGGAGDVVTVLALVAVANWLLMAGAELADAYL